jgi:hypothetical protein
MTTGIRIVPMALLCGLVLAALFRLTDELVVMAEVLGLFALTGGAIARRRAWVWGVGVGLGLLVSTFLLGLWFPAQPFQQSPRELSLYGPPQPLHLPFGLIDSPLAQQAVIPLVVVVFTVVAALAGWLSWLVVERVFE